jgi:hydroxymethylpyrimidine kinase/phosphomethylpyrimidine kinase
MPPAAPTRVPNVLSIAGSDSCGGAGIQADLATFSALRCHGMSVITALTAQNTRGVAAVHVVPPEFVARQIDVIFTDIEVAAVKIGMLATVETIEVVAERLAALRPPFIVLDPVLAATSGASLASAGVAEAIVRHLFPLATLVTPNLPEAAALSGNEVAPGLDCMRAAAEALQARGARAVLIKGGHGEGPTSDDLLLDGSASRVFSALRVATRNTHGTGCTLASAIAAFLAHGDGLADAIAAAKAYVSGALEAANALDVGHGPGPLHHFHALWASDRDGRCGDAEEPNKP